MILLLSLKKTVYMLAIQCLNRLEYMHACGFVHCAVAPENFAIGISERGRSAIHLINFQHAHRLNDTTATCVSPTIPNMTFASANMHRGAWYSRKDDLISLAYLIIYFHNGRLPWTRLLAIRNKKMRNQEMFNMKERGSVQLLCRTWPPSVARFLEAVMNLAEKDAPDYCALRLDLYKCMEYIEESNDGRFDWTDSNTDYQRNQIRWQNVVDFNIVQSEEWTCRQNL